MPQPLQGIENNLTIFDRLSEHIVQQAVNNVDLQQFRKIIIKNAQQGDENKWYVDYWFINVLDTIGHELYVLGFNVDSTVSIESCSTAVLEYKIKHLDIEYTSKNKFWNTSSIERRIAVELWIKCYKLSDGFIHWAGNIGKEYSDIIEMDHIHTLENRYIKFTKAAIPVAKGFTNFLEPILIMGLSGTIIYLFYSFRSK